MNTIEQSYANGGTRRPANIKKVADLLWHLYFDSLEEKKEDAYCEGIYACLCAIRKRFCS